MHFDDDVFAAILNQVFRRKDFLNAAV